MRADDWSFETARLGVAEWHVQAEGQHSAPSLAEIIRGLLVPSVTERLPESWQGPYSKQRAVAWIHDRDEEGTQLLAVSLDSREPVAVVFLHETSRAAAARPELRLGYLVAEPHWGRGYGSELVSGVVAVARGRHLDSIIAGVAAANLPSIRVLEKCGFTLVQDETASSDDLIYSIDL